MVKKLVVNKKFIDNIDEKFIDDFVNVPSGIPGLLMNILEKIDSDIGMKRMLVFEKHPEYESLDQDERIKVHNLIMANKTEEAQEYRVQNAIKFLNEYPKFRPIVDVEKK